MYIYSLYVGLQVPRLSLLWLTRVFGAMDETCKGQEPPISESEDYRNLSVRLFGMVVSLIAECPAVFEIARGFRKSTRLWVMANAVERIPAQQANGVPQQRS